jgi:hypothetical protein
MHLRLPSLVTVHILVARLTLQSLAVPFVTQSGTNNGVATGSTPVPSPKSDTKKEIVIGAGSAAVAGIAGALGATSFQRYKNSFRVIPSDARHDIWGKAGAQSDGGATKGSLTDQGFYVGDQQLHTPDQFTAATLAAKADGTSIVKVKIGNRRVVVDLWALFFLENPNWRLTMICDNSSNKPKAKVVRDTRKIAHDVQLYNDLAKYDLWFDVEGEWTKAFSTDEAMKFMQRENKTGAGSIKYKTSAKQYVREAGL